MKLHPLLTGANELSYDKQKFHTYLQNILRNGKNDESDDEPFRMIFCTIGLQEMKHGLLKCMMKTIQEFNRKKLPRFVDAYMDEWKELSLYQVIFCYQMSAKSSPEPWFIVI